MGKNAHKKRHKNNTRRPKGAYQSTDDGDDKPSSRKSKRNSKCGKKSKYDFDMGDTKIRKTLDADGLEIAEMDADGNCFFRSISDQLFGDHGKAHSCVRSAVCDFMEKNEGDFQVFLVFEDKDDKDQEEDARDFEDYIENMRRDGEWGGNLEVVAAARLYQRNVTVYSETLAAFTVDHGDSRSLGSDLLVSYHDNRHYNSVRNKLNPPKPIRVKHPPVNRRRTDTKANNNKNIDQQSSDIEEVTTSLSNLPITDEPEQIAIQNTKAVKRSAPCPCGSGLRYKKCCLAKQKSAARMKKLRAKREADEEGVEDFPVAKGSESSPEMFRVVAI